MLYAPLGQGQAPAGSRAALSLTKRSRPCVSFIKDREEGAVYAQDVMDEIDKRAEQSGKGGQRRVSSLRRAGRRALSG